MSTRQKPLGAQAHKFTNPNDPLIIEIERVNGAWEIRPSQTATVGSDSHSKIMDQRRQSNEAQILSDWTAKKLASAPAQPDFKDPIHPHVPIIVEPGEKVQFRVQGGGSFTIFIDRHHEVQNNGASPDNPAGFTGGHAAIGQSAVFTVAAGIRNQRFYKCRAEIDVNGTIEHADPDLIGE